MLRLPRSFFARPTLTVARELLGQRLVKIEGNKRLGGIITEVEAYIGEKDLACHARAGRTARTEVMYWSAGHLYVYFTYGMHWMICFVTERDGFPAAVLLRAIHADEGITVMRTRRKKHDHLTDGPAKISQALAIDKRWNGVDMCAVDSKLFIESTLGDGVRSAASRVIRSPRIGLGTTPEPWLSKKWNFKMNNL